MSRIGKAPIQIPGGVTVEVKKGNEVTVKGPKGQLTQKFDQDLSISQEDNTITISRPTDQKRHRSIHGLTRALLFNMVEGVTNGYTRVLELVGVGYRAANTGNMLELSVGYSHPIYFLLPDEVKLTTAMDKGAPPRITLESIDKQLIGQISAKIRAFRSPEPYKGKGIRYQNEQIRRKAGKTAGKK